jgi:hypothetical protein
VWNAYALHTPTQQCNYQSANQVDRPIVVDCAGCGADLDFAIQAQYASILYVTEKVRCALVDIQLFIQRTFVVDQYQCRARCTINTLQHVATSMGLDWVGLVSNALWIADVLLVLSTSVDSYASRRTRCIYEALAKLSFQMNITTSLTTNANRARFSDTALRRRSWYSVTPMASRISRSFCDIAVYHADRSTGQRAIIVDCLVVESILLLLLLLLLLHTRGGLPPFSPSKSKNRTASYTHTPTSSEEIHQ